MTIKRPWTEHVTWDKCPCGCDLYQLGNQRFGVFSEADARLFAAAPALYEALEAYVKETELKIKCAGTAGHLQKPYDAATAALHAANPAAFDGEGE